MVVRIRYPLILAESIYAGCVKTQEAAELYWWTFPSYCGDRVRRWLRTAIVPTKLLSDAATTYWGRNAGSPWLRVGGYIPNLLIFLNAIPGSMLAGVGRANQGST